MRDRESSPIFLTHSGEGDRELIPTDPYTGWTDAQWKEFVQEATDRELDAILEKGWRILEFHREAYCPLSFLPTFYQVIVHQYISINRLSSQALTRFWGKYDAEYWEKIPV